MILGTILVLLTWIVFLGLITVLGLALTLGRSGRTGRPLINLDKLRVSLWWGFSALILVILAVNLWYPLKSPEAAIVLGIVFIVALAFVLYRRPELGPLKGDKNSLLLIGISAPIVLSTLFLAFTALGPVTNYDSGLYHLGAIKYSGDFSTITGLANLYFPLGYNTSLYPFAAFLDNGPWGSEGYRLANGLIVSLVAMDIIFRLIATRGKLKRLTAGSWILITALLIGLVPIVALSDYWVTSPSSDAPVMILTFAACAYLADGVIGSRGNARNLATTFVIAVILFSLRPTMAIFLIGITVVIMLTLIRMRTHFQRRPSYLPLISAAVLGLMTLAIQSIRDYFLSGWIQFPLSLYSFNTPWTAEDPVWNRTATLGNARNPADIWGSIDGYEWIGPWLSRLPYQWETFLLVTLLIALLVLIGIAKLTGISLRCGTLVLIMIPSLLSSVTWFLISPPAFRFGWGPIFSLLLIPFGITLFNLSKQSPRGTRIRRVAPGSILVLTLGLLAVTGYTAALRLPKLIDPYPAYFTLGEFSLEYQLTPVVDVPVEDRVLPSGLVITVPTQSDQCWDNYPLCTPIVSESVRLRGAGIQDGFLP